MTPHKFGEVEIHLSEGCGGAWFDRYELEHFKWKDHEAGERLAALMERFQSGEPDPEEKHSCPRCGDVVLHRRFYNALRKVEIDECPACGGVWLEVGDLAKIRKLYPTPEERERVSKEFFKAYRESDKVKDFQESNQKMDKVIDFLNTFIPWT